MRVIRLAFVIVLAVILVGIALANRQMITVSLFPANFGQFLGGGWSLTMPAFLALFVAILFGVLVGFLWEWLRESSLRADASRNAHEVARLQREVAQLRQTHAAPKDEVMAILDAPRPITNAGAETTTGAHSLARS